MTECTELLGEDRVSAILPNTVLTRTAGACERLAEAGKGGSEGRQGEAASTKAPGGLVCMEG